MATTALQLINRALMQIHWIKYGQTASSDLLAQGLEQLCYMLAEWGSRRLTIPFRTWSSFSLVVGTGAYTIGPSGATVTAPRPEDFDLAFIRDGDSIDHWVTVVSEASYLQLRQKAMTGRPSIVWYNPTTPSGTATFFPVPDTVETFYYSHISPFAEPASTSATTVVPRNMDAVIQANLAVRLADMLELPVSPALQEMAEMGLRRILTQNAVRRARPASIDITKVSPLRDTSEGGGDAVEGLLLE